MIHKFILYFLILILTTSNIILSMQYSILSKEKETFDLFKNEQAKTISLKSKVGTYLSADNVNFRFAENVFVVLKKINALLIPIGKVKVVNFDDVNSFIISISHGDAYISPNVLETIFKEYIFNYESSVLKLNSIKFIDEKENKIFLNGSLKFIIWLEFEMIGTLSYDSKKKQILINTDSIKTIGISGAKSLLGVVALNLEKLLPVPEGRGISIIENTIYISPFEIFPPPKMQGEIKFIQIENNFLKIHFEDNTKFVVPEKPIPSSKNFLFLYGGDMKFGKLFMVETFLQMVDTDENDIFDFYLAKYYSILANYGSAKLGNDKSVKVYMPDYDDTLKK